MQQLLKIIERIDRKGYKAYNDLKGAYHFPDFILHLDHIQADPFASPSRGRVIVKRERLALGAETDETNERRVAVIDFFAQELQEVIKKQKEIKGIFIDGPGQEVMDRTAVVLREDELDIRFSIQLPARGRTILGKPAKQLLTEHLPAVIDQAVKNYSPEKLKTHIALADDQTTIRRFLQENHYTAFIANGSVLPRESGVSSRPLKSSDVVPFRSPPSLEVEIPLPHYGPIKGMALKTGVTVIVGGGYHGKSTLLEAIERGVYNHRSGDGREYVITDDSACKVRAEDGRSTASVNISPFISNLPNGKDTSTFSTENASGSTSQAANIMESLEAGTTCLLIDEDTSATNFMIRDARMQALVAKEQEPITPFIDKVSSLFNEHGVSTILVVGGAGDYFEVADCVVMMEAYVPYDVTEKAKEIARTFGSGREGNKNALFGKITERSVDLRSFQARKGKKEKVSAKGKDMILFGRDAINVSGVEQLVNGSQANAIANMIRYVCGVYDKNAALSDILHFLDEQVSEKGLDEVSPFKGRHPGDMAMPRKYEVAAAMNRHRALRVDNPS
ncbi:ABC-ATPase domain-containing protein [Bacillus piscicola]|uniref:ABC-ATPase domain-containing protein n=1 Tax=Bacillus piscicola TaxID=1632684 RepID=UPI001F097078|nr:ABC-ATPase domain-containing protein [Bacillus piscicola]